MNNLYIYITFFILLLLMTSIIFVVSLRKLYKKRKDFKPKIILFSLLSTLIISIIATVYCISLIITKSKSINSLSRPKVGEGNKTVSVNVESEIYTGTIDIEIQEKKLTFEEATKIFSKYRETLDENVLGNNNSFLKITKPLNFPSSIGEEEIAISWYISKPNIIDYTGNIITENILSEKEDLEIIATLTLDSHTAEICYFVSVYKSPLSPKEELSSYLNQVINEEHSLSEDHINLPSSMNDINLSFYETTSSFPPIFFYYNNNFSSNSIYFS